MSLPAIACSNLAISAPVASAAAVLVDSSSHYYNDGWTVRGMEMLSYDSHFGIWLSSTLKKRKTKMNKHKLRKRRKKERLKSK